MSPPNAADIAPAEDPLDLRQALSTALARVAGADESEPDRDRLLELVAVTAQAGMETRSLLGEAVTSARAAGASWDAIGRVLGMSRQAAQQRFGRVLDQGNVPGRRILGPVTAFSEMEALRVAGRHGWHSVGFGAYQHTLEHSPTQWEHRRIRVVAAGTRARLEGEGWQVIGTWFPWVYLKRDLGTPALPEG
ncbi:MAG: hypothetical protein ABJA74_10025 [Lapillicoccus sp.]